MTGFRLFEGRDLPGEPPLDPPDYGDGPQEDDEEAALAEEAYDRYLEERERELAAYEAGWADALPVPGPTTYEPF